MLRVRGVAFARPVTPPRRQPSYEEHLTRYMARVRKRRLMRHVFVAMRQHLWSNTNRTLRHSLHRLEITLAQLREGKLSLLLEDAHERMCEAKDSLEEAMKNVVSL